MIALAAGAAVVLGHPAVVLGESKPWPGCASDFDDDVVEIPAWVQDIQQTCVCSFECSACLL